MSQPTVEQVADFCLALMLRAYSARHGPGWSSLDPRAGIEDREELLVRWALSNQVRQIAETAVLNPRAIHSCIAFETNTVSGVISGSVDARATLLEQQIRGDSTLFVVTEPAVSRITRRNHVLAWVLREAETLIRAAIRRHSLGPENEWIHNHIHLLEKALLSPPLKDLLYAKLDRRRPGSAAIRDAGKSVAMLYKLSAQAAIAYDEIEQFRPDAIRQILADTIMSQFEPWQKLELATAISASVALSKASGYPIRWTGSVSGGGQIVAVGPYQVHWQYALPQRHFDLLDPSEQMVRTCAESLRSGYGLSRSDVTIRDGRSGADLAHLECKWCSSEFSVPQAISEALSQTVRYCRDSKPDSLDEARELLHECVIVCSQLGGFQSSVDGSRDIGLVAFSDLANNSLDVWADRLHKKHFTDLA